MRSHLIVNYAHLIYTKKRRAAVKAKIVNVRRRGALKDLQGKHKRRKFFLNIVRTKDEITESSFGRQLTKQSFQPSRGAIGICGKGYQQSPIGITWLEVFSDWLITLASSRVFIKDEELQKM